MTIRKLRITKAMAAEKTFRTLPEVDQFLDGIKEKLSDLDELTKSFQNQFARVEKAIAKDPQLASPFSFKVDFQGDGSSEPRKKLNIKTGKFDKVVFSKRFSLRLSFQKR